MDLQTLPIFSQVGDAMTLIFTNPLFTMIFAAIFLGHRLTLIKNISGNVVFFDLLLIVLKGLFEVFNEVSFEGIFEVLLLGLL